MLIKKDLFLKSFFLKSIKKINYTIKLTVQFFLSFFNLNLSTVLNLLITK